MWAGCPKLAFRVWRVQDTPRWIELCGRCYVAVFLVPTPSALSRQSLTQKFQNAAVKEYTEYTYTIRAPTGFKEYSLHELKSY